MPMLTPGGSGSRVEKSPTHRREADRQAVLRRPGELLLEYLELEDQLNRLCSQVDQSNSVVSESSAPSSSPSLEICALRDAPG